MARSFSERSRRKSAPPSPFASACVKRPDEDLSPHGPAREDIREIITYIRQRSPSAVKRVRIQFREAMRRLAEMPGLGHLRQDLADRPVRFFSVYSYLILYRPDVRPIEILRVLHGARNVKALLEEG